MSNPYNVQQTAVIGAGTMRRGIVISLARAGLILRLADVREGQA